MPSKKPLIQVCLYSCWFLYPANFRFQVTFNCCYIFPCIRGFVLKGLWRRFRTFIIWINEVVHSATSLLTILHAIWYSLICEKFTFLSEVFVGFHPRPGLACDADPIEKSCAVNSPFRSLLKSSMDQHAVKGQAKRFCLTALYFAVFNMFIDSATKNLNKKSVITQPQNYRLLQLLHISRVPEDTGDLPQ